MQANSGSLLRAVAGKDVKSVVVVFVVAVKGVRLWLHKSKLASDVGGQSV